MLSPAFWDSYDSTTIAYMAQHDARRQRLVLTCPPLLNLAGPVLAADFSASHGPLGPPRLVRRKRHDLLVFHCPQRPDWVAVAGQGLSGRIALMPDDTTLYAGRNVLYTLSKDNDLDWISDWMRWHHKAQGADALILVDNGSTAYGLEELGDRVARVGGYHAVRIVSAPFSYGAGYGTESRVGAGHYLQVALLNGFFRQIGPRARGFLNLDIDELVVSPGRESAFDLAARSWLGYVSLPGEWRHATCEGRAIHADHLWRAADEKGCRPKYCLRPGPVADRVTLKTHTVAWLPRWSWGAARQPYFIHHSDITTRWSSLRTSRQQGQLSEDQTMRSLYRKFLPVEG